MMRKIRYLGVSLMVALAAQAQEQGGAPKLDEIIVTAEIIDRPLSESGNSAEVFDQDTLRKQAGLVTLRDILDVSPNLSSVTGTGKAPTVRGVDGTGAAENAIAFFAGSRARLGLQVDGRPASYNEIIFGDLGIFDVERVEVLRGPQSSLVGRNAIAGTVVVNTQNPDFEFDAAAQIAGGNHDQKRTSGMINVPIVDDMIAFRLSADSYQRDSAIDFAPYEGVGDPGEIDALSLRAKVLFQPTADPLTRLLLTVTHTKYEGASSEIVARPFAERIADTPAQPVHIPQTTSVISDLTMLLTDTLSFELIASTTDFDFERKSLNSAGTIDTREYAVEPRLRYTGNNGLTAVTGIYYYRARQDEFIAVAGGLTFEDSTDTIAAYTEGVIDLNDSLDLSFGLRYEQEQRERNGGDATNTFVQISADETYDAVLPKIALNWKPTQSTSFGGQISMGYNAGGSGVSTTPPIVNFEYDAEYVLTYELFARQEFADGRVQTKQNVFYSDYDDMQLPFDLTPDNSRDESFVIRNADEVITWGAEFGLTVAATQNLGLFANIGFLDTEVTDYPKSGIEGNELLTAPNVTANAGVSWAHEKLSASITARYSDAYFTDANNRPRGKTDSYVVADAQVGYDFGRVRLFASVKNMFDTEKTVAQYPGVSSSSGQPDFASDTAVLLQSRTLLIGVAFDY